MSEGKDFSYLIGNKHAAGQKPNSTSFQPGFTPWNKGLKGIHLSPSSEFKKGQEPLRRYEQGEITSVKSKGGRLRQKIKIGDRMIDYAPWLWSETYGELIPDDVVHHLNGDSMDDRIENLIALPRKDHPKYHGSHGLKEIPEDKLSYYISRYVER